MTVPINKEESSLLVSAIIIMVISTLIGTIMVFIATTLIDFISKSVWRTIPVSWSPIVFFGGFLGGVIGGLLLVIELINMSSKGLTVADVPNQMNGLFFVISLLFLAYILEILTENILTQLIIYLLGCLFVALVCHDLTKKSMVFFILEE